MAEIDTQPHNHFPHCISKPWKNSFQSDSIIPSILFLFINSILTCYSINKTHQTATKHLKNKYNIHSNTTPTTTACHIVQLRCHARTHYKQVNAFIVNNDIFIILTIISFLFFIIPVLFLLFHHYFYFLSFFTILSLFSLSHYFRFFIIVQK